MRRKIQRKTPNQFEIQQKLIVTEGLLGNRRISSISCVYRVRNKFTKRFRCTRDLCLPYLNPHNLRSIDVDEIEFHVSKWCNIPIFRRISIIIVIYTHGFCRQSSHACMNNMCFHATHIHSVNDS